MKAVVNIEKLIFYPFHLQCCNGQKDNLSQFKKFKANLFSLPIRSSIKWKCETNSIINRINIIIIICT